MVLCSVSCPTEVSRSSQRPSYYAVSACCVLHTQTFRLCRGTLCAPNTGNLWEGGHKYGRCCSLDRSPCLFGLNRLASLRVLLSESSSWTFSWPGSPETDTENWRGKRVKQPSLSPYANMREILGQEQCVRSAVERRESCLFFVLPQSTIYLNIYMISC